MHVVPLAGWNHIFEGTELFVHLASSTALNDAMSRLPSNLLAGCGCIAILSFGSSWLDSGFGVLAGRLGAYLIVRVLIVEGCSLRSHMDHLPRPSGRRW